MKHCLLISRAADLGCADIGGNGCQDIPAPHMDWRGTASKCRKMNLSPPRMI